MAIIRLEVIQLQKISTTIILNAFIRFKHYECNFSEEKTIDDSRRHN